MTFFLSLVSEKCLILSLNVFQKKKTDWQIIFTHRRNYFVHRIIYFHLKMACLFPLHLSCTFITSTQSTNLATFCAPLRSTFQQYLNAFFVAQTIFAWEPIFNYVESFKTIKTWNNLWWSGFSGYPTADSAESGGRIMTKVAKGTSSPQKTPRYKISEQPDDFKDMKSCLQHGDLGFQGIPLPIRLNPGIGSQRK